MVKSFVYPVAFSIAVFFTSCGGEEKKTELVQTKDTQITEALKPLVISPAPEFNTPFEIHEIDADSGANIYIANSLGSSIQVPPGILVDSLRKPVSGKVNFSYRELHDAADIFLAGIPMDYDAAGIIKRFETAGMFEIRAEQDGKKVYVDSGKTITVSFGGEIPGNDFRFFYLDETLTRNWHYMGEEGGVATGKKKLNTNVLALKVPLGPDYFSFNYMAALDVMLNDNLQMVNSNKNNPDMQKKVKAYGLNWSNIYNYQQVEFRGKKYLASLLVWKSLTGHDFPEWASSATSTLTHKSGYTYDLKLADKKGHEYYAIIEAVMPIKDLFASSPEKWKSAYEEAVRKLKEEEQRQKTLADVYRTFEINRFGIYNYDKFMNDKNAVTIHANFIFDKAVVKENIEIFYVNETNRTLVKFPYHSWKNFFIFPAQKGKLFALLPHNFVAVYDSKKLGKVDYDGLKNPGMPDVTFDMVTKKQITSAEELREIISGL